MTVHRFEGIFSHLYCNDNTMQKQRGVEGYERLFKIRPIIAKLNDNFRKNAERETHVSVDEQIIPFKGRHSLKINMLKKPKKWGLPEHPDMCTNLDLRVIIFLMTILSTVWGMKVWWNTCQTVFQNGGKHLFFNAVK